MKLSPKFDWLLLAIAVLMILSLFCCSGCFGSKKVLKGPPQLSEKVVGEIAALDLEEARRYAMEQRAQAEAAMSVVDQLEAQRSRDRLDWLHTLSVWICAASILIGVVSIGAAIWLRSKTLAAVALSALGMLCCGLFTGWVIDHAALAITGVGVLAAIAGGFFLWDNYRVRQGLKGAIKVAEYLKPKIEETGAKQRRREQQALLAGKGAKVIDEFRTRLMKPEKAG